MNKEQILEIAKETISYKQTRITSDAPKHELIYLMGFNDGVLELCNELIKMIEEVGEDE